MSTGRSMLVARSVALSAALLGFTSTAFGAKVLNFKADKGIVVLDEGKGAGFTKGTEVCIYDSSDAELVCGKITSATDKNASLRLAKDKMSGIEKGLAVRPKGASGEEAATTTTGGKKKSAAKGKASSKYMRNIKLMYVPGLVPAPFSSVSEGINKDSASGASEFKDIGSNSFGLIGLGLEAEFPVGSKSMATGFRYRIFSTSTAQADYSKTQSLQYWETTQSGTAIGLWFDYYFMQSVLSKSSIFKLGSGLDYDMSSVSIAASAKTDDATKAPIPASAQDISIESKVSVISLRIPASFVLFFDPIGLNFDVVPMVPLVEMGASYTSSEADSGEASKEIVKHKKGSIAADIRIGFFFSF